MDKIKSVQSSLKSHPVWVTLYLKLWILQNSYFEVFERVQSDNEMQMKE